MRKYKFTNLTKEHPVVYVTAATYEEALAEAMIAVSVKPSKAKQPKVKKASKGKSKTNQ